MIKLIKQFFMGTKTVDNTSPVGGNRGCLCDDDVYRIECCNGDLQNQGVGSLVSGGQSTVTNTDTSRTITRQNG